MTDGVLVAREVVVDCDLHGAAVPFFNLSYVQDSTGIRFRISQGELNLGTAVSIRVGSDRPSVSGRYRLTRAIAVQL